MCAAASGVYHNARAHLGSARRVECYNSHPISFHRFRVSSFEVALLLSRVRPRYSEMAVKLIASLTSPYARKVRIALAEKKIDCELVVDSPWEATTGVTAHNPLGKVPVLMLDDGTALYDSRVIVEYLDTVSPVSRLIPEPNRQRIAVETLGSAGRRDLRCRSRDRPGAQASSEAAEQGLDRAAAGQDRPRDQGSCARARRQTLVQRRSVYVGGHRHRMRARLSRSAPRRYRLAKRVSQPAEAGRQARQAAFVPGLGTSRRVGEVVHGCRDTALTLLEFRHSGQARERARAGIHQF